jgi:hypothetical protein
MIVFGRNVQRNEPKKKKRYIALHCCLLDRILLEKVLLLLLLQEGNAARRGENKVSFSRRVNFVKWTGLEIHDLFKSLLIVPFLSGDPT